MPTIYKSIGRKNSSGGLEPCYKRPIHLRNILRWNREGSSHLRETSLRISTPEEWAQKRQALGQILMQFLGSFPATVVALDPRIVKKESLNGYTRTKVEYNVGPDDKVAADYKASAYLLIPANLTKLTPAVLALHQTVPEGKDEPVGISGNPNMHYGLELVERGHVVLAPDSITAGDRVYPGSKPFDTAPFHALHPDWSAMGKMLWDHMRGIDYLQSLPLVDRKRIGVIGHSLGGYNSFFLAAFDERIKVAVSSCGLATIAGDPNPFRWARNYDFVHFPKLRPYLEVGCTPPFDFHEVISRIAPQPFLTFSKKQDRIFPNWQGVVAAAAQASEVYALFGAKHKFKNVMKSGAHDFPPSSRATAYQWIDRWLKGEMAS